MGRYKLFRAQGTLEVGREEQLVVVHVTRVARHAQQGRIIRTGRQASLGTPAVCVLSSKNWVRPSTRT